MNRVSLALARRYGNTRAWSFARAAVERAIDQFREVSLFLYDFDQQRIAREAVREREKAEAGKQALEEVNALIARLQADEKVEVIPPPTPEEAKRFREAGLALGRKLVEDVRLRASTGKMGRN